LKANNI